jgi:electron transport complex protein RnfG
MKNIIKPALVLAAVAFCSSLFLSYMKEITSPLIKQQEREKEQNALMMVLPGYETGEPQIVKLDNGEEFKFWIGEKETDDGVLKGYAFLSVNYGYSGDIKSMVGVDENNIVLGISIVQQSETPGLGDRVNEKATSETIWGVILGKSYGGEGVTEPWFQDQFKGIDLNKKIKIVKQGTWTSDIKDDLLSQNAVSAITGATITTKAITGSLKEGLIKLAKAKILTESGENRE